MAKDPQHRERDPGRKTHDADEGQPSDPVRSQRDESGARMADESVDQPPAATPRPVKAGEEVPREVEPIERVAPGGDLKRYKVRMNNYTASGMTPPTKYILGRAGDAGKKEVQELYLKLTGIGDEMKQLKDSGMDDKDIPKPLFVVKELPD